MINSFCWSQLEHIAAGEIQSSSPCCSAWPQGGNASGFRVALAQDQAGNHLRADDDCAGGRDRSARGRGEGDESACRESVPHPLLGDSGPGPAATDLIVASGRDSYGATASASDSGG